MTHASATLLAIERHGASHVLLRLGDCPALAASRPGQFVMLRGDWGRDPLLPRAISILSADGDSAELLVKIVGRATSRLAAARPGDRLSVLGPLGTSFPDPGPGERQVAIAGGCGVPPLLFHATRAAAAGRAGAITVLVGARGADDLVLTDRLGAIGVAHELATEDGSRGARGRVTDLLAPLLADRPTLLACGPDPMLRAVAAIAHARGLRAFLSLEGEMACGLGACLGCAVHGKEKPFLYACQDGPVIELARLGGRFAEGQP
jgi:dihydroorotate dehydrogenase electron transfer subunit